MRTLFTSLLAGCMLFISLTLDAQNNFWKFADETNLKAKSQFRQIIPEKYKTLRLNVSQMKALLKDAPLWQTAEAEKKSLTVTLPMPDGSFQRFRLVEAPVMHPDLGKKFPEIRSYAGTGIDDQTAYLRCDFTPKGFHGMVRTALTSTVYIDPYSTADIENYIVYYREDFHKNDGWECWFDQVNDKKTAPPPAIFDKAGDCKLRTYSLALACTGEYAQFHGGTVASALAAMNTTMTRVNGVFENDASVHMDLVPNNNLLVFLDPNTDPYTNNNGSTMLGQNQTTCNNVIGSANYDIGHVFSTGGGGVAYLGCVCNNSLKAGGVTGQANPVGDPFDIDYVAHEMGHQYGANHTQNNNCNRNNATAMEPGSASTIMGYAGICPPNVQNNSDDYFHAISLQEMGNFTVGSGNSCATVSTINSAPTANAGPDYTIPKSTPFVLTGSGTDPNSTDVLKYIWEQMDPQVATMPPVSTNTGGPAFRSYKYTTSPSRYFPRLQDLVNNVSPTWEVLPSVARTLNFRFTVRDNHVGGGCTKEDNAVITVNGTAGPFVVTAPNTAVTWQAGTSQTVTWNVAGTTAAPVSCANVDIFLSLDGGFTYPITLATATPNDGSQAITVPNNPTSLARVMVKANGNVFFDISNANFTINAPSTGFTLDVTPDAQTVCQPNNAQFTVNIGSTGGFSGNVTLSASGVPSGASASFSVNPVAAPGTSILTISGTGSVAPGTYNITVTGTGSSGSQSETVALTISAGAPAQVTLSAPANGATGASQTPTLTWNAASGAVTYEVQIATDPGFSNLVVNATGVTGTTYNVTTSLAGNTLHYWRVRAVSTCGNGAYSTAFSFTTGNTTCSAFPSNDVPKTISASGTPTVTSTLNIGASGSITDVNLLNLNISHTWINDLVVKLKSPTGTEITLINQICNSEDNILTNFDDEAPNPYSALPCPPTNNGFYQPFQALSAFDGQNLSGVWTLTIQDLVNQDGGTLNAWSLQVCYSGGSAPPLAVTATGTNVTCNGGSNGTATANATGGSGSYTYAWSNGGNTQTITSLAAGTYNVTVTSGGQTATASVVITQPAALSVSATGTNASCGSNNGTATANPSGGTSPYSYLWSNGGTTQTITGLAAGTYTVTTTDDNGCTASSSVTIVSSSSMSVNVTGTNVSCNGGNNGTATANPVGGTPPYTYAWSNGGTTQTISGLAAGTYNVTVTSSNGCSGTGSVTITQPAALTVSVSGVNPTSGNNGSATANPSGGTSPYSYLWSNGGTTQTITGLGAGTYTVTVTDANNCTATGSVTLTGGSALKFEYGVLSSVTNDWQTVNLANSYNSMVVVATVVLPNNATSSLVTRIQNASGSSFQVKVQIAGNEAAAVSPMTVHYMVAEEGTYTVAQHGVKFEAKKVTAAQTAGWSPGWALETRSYSNAYTSPVVVGQVMTYNDALFSVFWASRSNNISNPPTGTSFAAGKHIAQDNDVTTRLSETIGYMVFESGSGTINGKRYLAGLGSDNVRGLSNSSAGYTYSLSGFASVDAAVVSSAAMDATEGAWAVMATTTPLSTTALKMWACEDQIADSERSHTTEQMAYLVIGNASSLASNENGELSRESTVQPDVLLAYPNPATATLTVEFTRKGAGNPTLLVLDVLGKTAIRREVQADTEGAKDGYHKIYLDVSQLQPGYYVLQLLDGKEAKSIRFVKAE
jgi:subtilisin-like proprotein convertase family protein